MKPTKPKNACAVCNHDCCKPSYRLTLKIKVKRIKEDLQLFLEMFNQLGGIYPDYSDEEGYISSFKFLGRINDIPEYGVPSLDIPQNTPGYDL